LTTIYRRTGNQKFGAALVLISRQTLSSWVLKMGAALEVIAKYLQKYIMKSGYVKADEPPAQVLKRPIKRINYYRL